MTSKVAFLVSIVVVCAASIGCEQRANPPAAPPPGPPGSAVMYRAEWSRLDHPARLAVYDIYERLGNKGPAKLDAAATDLLTSLADRIAALMAAAADPVCDFQLDDSRGVEGDHSHLGELRLSSRLLIADAHRLASAGDADAAAQRLVAVLRMANQLRADRRVLSSSQAAALADLAATHTARIIDPAALAPGTRAAIASAAAALLGDDPFGAKAAIRHEKLVHLHYGYSSESLDPRTFTARDLRRAEAYYDAALAAWDEPDAEARLLDLALEAETEQHESNPRGHKHGPIAREALPGKHTLPTRIRDTSARLEALIRSHGPPAPSAPAP